MIQKQELESSKKGTRVIIGMTHFRVGETDGVSLEMDKWKQVLERNGHKVYYIAGTSGPQEAFIVAEMDYRGHKDSIINEECYKSSEIYSKEELKTEIEKMAKKIEKKFVEIIEDNNIDMLIPNNLLSLGRSPHIAMAITNAVIKTGIKIIGHHHDFYWERDYFNNPQNEYVQSLLDKYFPPVQLENMIHVVINKSAKKDLLTRKGKESLVVPNVFEFNNDLWVEDDYNKTYKQDLGIGENEVLFLQATRVTNRKSIELAVDLVAMLDTPKYRNKLIGKTLYNGNIFDENTKLTIAMIGLHEGGDNYENKLINYAKQKNVRLLVRPDLVAHSRKMNEDGTKVYSLWDAYVHCDMITYPSIYEGWGNQFLEGLFAKKPQIVFEYSVFTSDIKAFGFDYISLGNTYTLRENKLAKIEDDVLENAAEETIKYLCNKQKYYDCVNRNFDIGKKNLSIEALEKLIKTIL